MTNPVISPPISTACDSFKAHDHGALVTDFRSERDQYIKNKTRSSHGGDWFGADEAAVEVPPKVVNPSKGGKGEISNYAVSFNGVRPEFHHEKNWLAHRRKKAVTNDEGKHFNILTGSEQALPVRVSAKRVSADRLERLGQESEVIRKNIITNL
ncbi:hypothetical protein HK101_009731 [Irineochytrium annulatum]|nr:hypothetical protein HK101_009731 [Irineochytrium annulatum]